jgi:hypothetical protein
MSAKIIGFPIFRRHVGVEKLARAWMPLTPREREDLVLKRCQAFEAKAESLGVPAEVASRQADELYRGIYRWTNFLLEQKLDHDQDGDAA